MTEMERQEQEYALNLAYIAKILGRKDFFEDRYYVDDKISIAYSYSFTNATCVVVKLLDKDNSEVYSYNLSKDRLERKRCGLWQNYVDKLLRRALEKAGDARNPQAFLPIDDKGLFPQEYEDYHEPTYGRGNLKTSDAELRELATTMKGAKL
jgi:hypothetical protein